MSWTSLDTGIVVVAAVSAMACALIGSFLVLRRMSMMGDAISHAVLPGIAAAFLLTLSRDTGVIVAGAAVAGVLTAAFTQLIHQAGNVDRGAAMGVVFTTMFALGLILIVRSADAVHVDVHTVFYGAVELAPLNEVTLAGLRLPRALLILGAVFAADLAFVLLLYKELNLTSFDPEFARAAGFPAPLLHYALMVMVAVTIVAAFESVGSILVIAMLIVPGAVAGLFTRRLWSLLLTGQGVALICAVGGHLGAITVPRWFGLSDTSTAGMMTVAAGAVVALALVAAPERGLLARALRRARLALAVGREDLLVELLRVAERGRAAAGRRELVREETSRIAGRSSRWSVARRCCWSCCAGACSGAGTATGSPPRAGASPPACCAATGCGRATCSPRAAPPPKCTLPRTSWSTSPPRPCAPTWRAAPAAPTPTGARSRATPPAPAAATRRPDGSKVGVDVSGRDRRRRAGRRRRS